MIRTILIDDEYWTLKGLEKIIDWEAMDFKIVGSYNSPQEALEKIKNGLVCSLIITDIRMPEMNGLDMIAEIQRICPNMYFVLISGYAEFTYAQQALRLQISDYILKPIDKNELIKVLQKVKIKINNHNPVASLPSIEKEMQGLKNMATFGSTVVEDSFWNDCKNERFVFCISTSLPDEAANLSKNSRIRSKVFSAENSKYVFVFCADESELKACLPQISTIFNGVQSGICLQQTDMDIPKVFRLAMNAYYTHFFNPNIICSVSTAPNKERIRPYVEAFQNFFNSMKYDKLYQTIENFYAFATEEKLDADAYIIFYNHIAQMLNPKLSTQNLGISFLSTGSLQEYHNGASAYALLYNGIDTIQSVNHMDSVSNQQSAKSLIPSIQKYINDNFQNELNLSILSTKFLVSEKYLSSLFKELTGYTLTSYITNIRIEKSKLLLEKSNLNVQNIAYLCGFNDYFYFAKLFKKTTGLTPSEYRQIHSKSENDE